MRDIMILGLFFLMLATGCQAGIADSLSLEQAVALALRQNPGILAAQEEIRISLGRRLQMQALPAANFVLSDEGIAFNPGKHPDEERELSFGVEQALEFPGKLVLRGRVGRFGEQIADYGLARTGILVKAGVKEAYYKTVLGMRTIRTLGQTAKLLDEFIESASIKYQAGEVLYLDVLRARIEKAKIRNEIIEAGKELAADKTRLNLLLGQKGDSPLELTTDLAFIPLTRDLASLQEEAERTRPSVLIASLKLEQARAGLKLSQMSRLPDFSLGLFFPSRRMNAWGFALGVSVPVFSNRKQKGEILEAEAQNAIEEISVEAVRRTLRAQVESAFIGAKAAEEQVKLFEETLLTEVEDQLSMSITQYQYGKIDALNLLDIFRTSLEARREYLKALFLYLVSLSDLERAGEGSE